MPHGSSFLVHGFPAQFSKGSGSKRLQVGICSGTRDVRSCTLSAQILGPGRAANQTFQASGRRLGSFPSQMSAATCDGANHRKAFLYRSRESEHPADATVAAPLLIVLESYVTPNPHHELSQSSAEL